MAAPRRAAGASRWGLRGLDALLALLLLALGAALLLRAASAAALLAGAALSLAALLVAYASAGTAAWLSKAHLADHSTAAATAHTSLRHRRSVGRRMPCPYPDAWYALTLSDELRPGDVVDITVCGHALVVFRPLDGGLPSALDAICTHMGAHLAHGGGRLADDGCIRCPFHGWCFDKTGKLVRTGTDDAPPAGSDLRSWTVMERNGVVSVWMSAACHRQAAARPSDDQLRPWFSPPVISELDGGAGTFVYHGFSEHVVPALIFELPENGADIGHLTALHSDFVVASLRPLLSHKWAASWRADEKQAHLARVRIAESMVLLRAFTLPGTVEVEILQCGPSQVFLSFRVPGIGHVFIIETVTPVAPAQQRVLHACYAAPHIPRLVAKALLASVVRAYEQDLPVWAHKSYSATPRLTSSETAIKTYRQWVKQFIASEHAISFEEAQKAQLRVDLGLPDDASLDW